MLLSWWNATTVSLVLSNQNTFYVQSQLRVIVGDIIGTQENTYSIKKPNLLKLDHIATAQTT